MRRMFSLSVVLCLVCFLAAHAQAQSFLKINEAETQAVFQTNQLQTNLVLENQAQPFAGKVRLEILDAADNVLAASETAHQIKRGRQNLRISLAFTQAPEADNLLWYRLRYSVAPEANPALSAASGIVSLSEIMPELFTLQISASEKIFAGMRLRAHVLALHPLTRKPIKNVDVTGEISLELDTERDEDELKIVAGGKTNDEGYVSLSFQIPPDAKLSGDGEITVKGEKNGITRAADNELEMSDAARVYLNLDKPLYQPNQKLFARGLYLTPLRRPLAGKDVEFKITDEEGETVYEETVKTSRFGVANINWQIPASLKLGKYLVEVENEDGDTIGQSEFKVTRYDLPNFSVSAKADRSFYLPGQDSAEIVVSAKYLFGKPVAAGKVRLAQESSRQWDYEEQEWKIDEAKSYEGATDAEGKFLARVDLSEAQDNLRRQQWKHFEDLHFAAYFTDATTGRTELRRFDLRLSKEAIHIYFIHYGMTVNPNLPYQFYVSTFYADGSPARCDIAIKANHPQVEGEKTLAETKTNSYGAGKLEIRIPEKPFPEAKNEFNLRISARDRDGATGTFSDNFYLDENVKQIRVKTDKTVYLPNEPIEAKLHSSANNEIVYVDVLKDSSVIYSKRIRLGDGRAAFQIPPRPDFKGELTISAYFNADDEDEETVSHSKNIIFPSPGDLKLSVKSLKEVYRPNEEAKIAFNVRSAAGQAAETALGVVILDKAIEERALIEQAPDNYADLRRLTGTEAAFGRLTRRDLNNLDLNKPVDADLQLAAEFLLINKSYQPQFFKSSSYQKNFGEIFRDYFLKKLQPLENALRSHHEKTADFPKDETSLRQILSANGINFDELRDAWGTPYAAEFRTDRNYTILTLKTTAADKKFGTEDDFDVRRVQFEWFAKTQNELTVALNNYIERNNKKGPQTIDELKGVWKRAGFDADALRDNWNQPFYITTVKYNHFVQKPFAETIGKLDGETQQVSSIKPVLQEILLFRLHSAGADAVRDTEDDFAVGAFSVVLSEKDLTGAPAGKISKTGTTNGSGAITGTITDPTGAVVVNADVTLVNQMSGETFESRTNDEGVYMISNLPSGKYRVTAHSPGFLKTVFENIVISSMTLIKLDIYLNIIASAATVTVTAEQSVIDQQTNSSASTTVTRTDAKSISGAMNMSGNRQTATPRVREYFPETLLWQPELITDKNGRAELKFTLADNLTTWKLYAVGSTEAGEIGLVEKEVQTFQPFFAELEPPRILTEGDEIALPVPVRNYTDRRQKVSVSMTENDWSNLLGGATQQIEIAPDGSQNAIFNFRASSPVKDGKQKVTALAAKGEADAIEKPVTVKPNGKEIVGLQSQLFRENAVFEVNFPANAFPNTRRAELKIYPNMLAHVAESVEGLLRRPTGCGEQTTSSTYPNLLILKIEKDLGKAVNEKTKNQAQIFLRQGYERLLNYQTPSGGFSYWGKTDAPNVALTAYVLRFLNDARGFTEVDEKVIEGAQNWLLKQQRADGSWQTNYVSADSSTAYIARSLSMKAQPDEETKKALRAALEFLKKRLPEIKDAYALANFALACLSAGDTETAARVAENLNSAGRNDGESFFWTTENTSFYGWGTTAKIETTALVMQVFLRLSENSKFAENLARGLTFLLKNKDRYGVWYSTQTTVNVLDTMILLQKSIRDTKANAGEKAEIYVNGKKIQDFSVDINALSHPFLIDAAPYLTEAENRIEIKNAGNSTFIQAQMVAAHYIAWKDIAPEASPYFDLKVSFDKTEAKIGEEITGAVSIESKTNRSGMMLAEIGIPPGADVDRNSLENAKKLDRNISRYDVLPDKIIVYFWSDSRPLNFKFKFKPRFGINAQSAPSLVYDYYNEEARATVAPARFGVK